MHLISNLPLPTRRWSVCPFALHSNLETEFQGCCGVVSSRGAAELPKEQLPASRLHGKLRREEKPQDWFAKLPVPKYGANNQIHSFTGSLRAESCNILYLRGLYRPFAAKSAPRRTPALCQGLFLQLRDRFPLVSGRSSPRFLLCAPCRRRLRAVERSRAVLVGVIYPATQRLCRPRAARPSSSHLAAELSAWSADEY